MRQTQPVSPLKPAVNARLPSVATIVMIAPIRVFLAILFSLRFASLLKEYNSAIGCYWVCHGSAAEHLTYCGAEPKTSTSSKSEMRN